MKKKKKKYITVPGLLKKYSCATLDELEVDLHEALKAIHLVSFQESIPMGLKCPRWLKVFMDKFDDYYTEMQKEYKFVCSVLNIKERYWD